MNSNATEIELDSLAWRTVVGPFSGEHEPFPVDEYPNLVAFITEHAIKPGYDYGDEFEYWLDLILNGIERVRSDRGDV